MKLINDINRLKEIVHSAPFCLLYIQAPDCGLCSVMLKKVEQVTHNHEMLRSAHAELQVVPEIAGTFLVATAPTVLVFVRGKEVFRSGTFIDTLKLEQVLTMWEDNLNCF